VIRQVRWCTAVQTPVNCHCELKENSIRDVEPVELVVQQLCGWEGNRRQCVTDFSDLMLTIICTTLYIYFRYICDVFFLYFPFLLIISLVFYCLFCCLHARLLRVTLNKSINQSLHWLNLLWTCCSTSCSLQSSLC